MNDPPAEAVAEDVSETLTRYMSPAELREYAEEMGRADDSALPMLMQKLFAGVFGSMSAHTVKPWADYYERVCNAL